MMLPAGFCVCSVVAMGLSIRTLKILRSVYLHNSFHLEPAAVYKSDSTPSFQSAVKSFVPLCGAVSYNSPQFDLPTSVHILLGFVHLSLLWGANVGFSWEDEEFSGVFAGVAAVGATSVAVGLTYLLHFKFVDSFNTKHYPEPVSQSGTELNRRSPRRQPEGSTFIDTSVLPKHREVSFDPSPPPPLPPQSKMTAELLLLVYLTVSVVVDFWSLGVFSSVNSPITSGVVFGWLMGIGVDLVLRTTICSLLTAVHIVPNYSRNYYVIDLGLTPTQLHKFSKTPTFGLIDVLQPNIDRAETPQKESFYQENGPVSPPPSSPKVVRRMSPERRSSPFRLPAINSHQKRAGKDFAKDLDEFLEAMDNREEIDGEGMGKKGSPERGRRSPVRVREEPAGESVEESGRESEDTMPEVQHNMLSPVETPRGYSGMRFYRTPERPYIGSPERSPDKPRMGGKSPPKFELRLQAVKVASSPSHSESEPESQFITYSSEARGEQSETNRFDLPSDLPPNPPTDWNPDPPDDYMVEFLPGGIMPEAELLNSQYHFGPNPPIALPGYRSQSLPKPQTAVERGTRARSGEHKPPTPRAPGGVLKEKMRGKKESWVRSPTSADKERLEMPKPGRPSMPLYTEEDNPISDSLREISNTDRLHALTSRRKPRIEVEQTVEQLLQAAKSDPNNQEYERLAEILAARNSFRRKHVKQSISPYNASMLGLLREKDSTSVSRLVLVEDADSAVRQAEHIQALSNIYGSSSRPRSRPKSNSRENSRGRSRSMKRGTDENARE